MENLLKLDRLPLSLDYRKLANKLRVRENSSMALKLRDMVDEARELGRPKALVRTSFIQDRGDDHVVLDGVRFNSRVLRINLDDVHRAFPFVATCGRELAAWSETRIGVLERYWGEEICTMAVVEALAAVKTRLEQDYRLEQLSHMSPGSLEDWPLSEQSALFALLGGPVLEIGVELEESLLMRPLKTVSGILFSSLTTFHSCQLCPRSKCPGRRAPYDENLFGTRYQPDPDS